MGLGLGGILFGAIHVVAGEAAPGLRASALLGAMVGSVVGTAQWFVLRNHISRSGWWILATAIALAVFGVANPFRPGETFFGSIAFIGPGIPAGLGQWLILRRKFLRAGWWILATVVGSAVAFPVGIATAIAGMATAGVIFSAALGTARGPVPFYSGVALGFAVTGAVLGAITGGVLVWLLRHLRQDQIGS